MSRPPSRISCGSSSWRAASKPIGCRAGTALASASSLRKQAAALAGKASGDAAAALAEFGKQVDAAAGPPTSPEEFYDVSQASPTSLLRLVVSLARLQGSIESADVAPTPDAATGFAQRQEALEQGLARWNRVVQTDLPKVNAALGRRGASGPEGRRLASRWRSRSLSPRPR